MSSIFNGQAHRRIGRRAARRWAMTGLALTGAAAIPVPVLQAAPAQASTAMAVAAEPAAPPTEPAPMATALPTAPILAVIRSGFEGRTPLDQMRAEDCLAQAIYYEAGSESEAGQRAVAQVVLNRVRHPAWPDSVCGVVYQGPLRAGGGCQFTFTCDGALLVQPVGAAWARARRLAAEALAGFVYRPVGLSTHYHTAAVFPSWAPTLLRTAAIGAHRFYRLRGPRGDAAAFTDAYTGIEPLPRTAFAMLRRPVQTAGLASMVTLGRISAAASTDQAFSAMLAQQARPAADATAREAYRALGQWRALAPESNSGR